MVHAMTMNTEGMQSVARAMALNASAPELCLAGKERPTFSRSGSSRRSMRYLTRASSNRDIRSKSGHNGDEYDEERRRAHRRSRRASLEPMSSSSKSGYIGHEKRERRSSLHSSKTSKSSHRDSHVKKIFRSSSSGRLRDHPDERRSLSWDGEERRPSKSITSSPRPSQSVESPKH